MTVLLETKRLIVKASLPSDIKCWLTLYAESETTSYLESEVREWLAQDIIHFKRHSFSMGSVYEKDSKKFIGRAGLVYLDYNDAQPDIEVGYILHKAYWGKGYATELAQACVDWGFNNLTINKVVAVTSPENKRSQRVLEKVNMKYVKKIPFRGEEFLLYEVYKL